MKILYTAFKGLHNTSFQLVEQLSDTTLLLTNSFQGLEKDISSITDNYHSVYMFGVDKNLTGKVRIETCAKYNGEIVFTEFNVNSLENRLQNCRISYNVSGRPSQYLCNAAYYHMLRKNSNTVFIHIPSTKGMDAELMNKLVELFL